MKHLRAIIFEKKVKHNWSQYLPLVQRILNFTNDSSIGTHPSKIVFGDMLPMSVHLDIKISHDQELVSDYLRQLKQGQESIILASQAYLIKQAQKQDNRAKVIDPTKSIIFKAGDYVLLTYPSRPPTKLSAMYRGPLIVLERKRDDMFQLQDLISEKVLTVHVSRLRLFVVPDNAEARDILALAAVDAGEELVEMIVDHRGDPRKKAKMEFKIRFQGFDPSEDQWIPWRDAKDLEAMDNYSKEHFGLNLG